MKYNSKVKNQKSKLRCASHIFLKFLILSCSFAFLTLSFELAAKAITANEIIDKVDANMTYLTGRFETEMVIHVRDQIRVKKLISYAEGRDKSFAEFIYPARDEGVKYLKIEDNMWMYLPSVEKVIKIAGHMLRQSMMGSDFSYEDALESTKLLEKYSVKLLTDEAISIKTKKGTEEITSEHSCYVLDLTAKVKEVTYYRRKIWVDKFTFLPVKEELFAKSGKKLKVMVLGDVERFRGRYYPLYISMQNLLRKDSLTEMYITKAQFDIRIPSGTFTQRNLTK